MRVGLRDIAALGLDIRSEQEVPAQAATAAIFLMLLMGAFVGQSGRQSFNAARAMQYTHEVVAFGARPIGSPNHKKLENYILNHLKGEGIEEDAFIAETPEGKFPGAQPDCQVSRYSRRSDRYRGAL